MSSCGSYRQTGGTVRETGWNEPLHLFFKGSGLRGTPLPVRHQEVNPIMKFGKSSGPGRRGRGEGYPRNISGISRRFLLRGSATAAVALQFLRDVRAQDVRPQESRVDPRDPVSVTSCERTGPFAAPGC